MAIKLPASSEIKARLRRILRPHSKLGKTTLWFGGLALLLELFRWITRSPSGTLLSGWATFITFVFALCAFFMGFRWMRRQLLWRLRNRLIVTYVFIGVIPIVLLATMGLVAGYLFAGQFATYVAMSDLQSELQHLESANDSLAVQFRSLLKAGKLNEQLATEIARGLLRKFPPSHRERMGGRERLHPYGGTKRRGKSTDQSAAMPSMAISTASSLTTLTCTFAR